MELESINTVEEKRFDLFRTRAKYLRYISIFRNIVPIIVTGFMIVGNAVTVIFSEWLTTLNFNGRVNEAWKKAYLRSSGPAAAAPAAAPASGGGPPAPAPGVAPSPATALSSTSNRANSPQRPPADAAAAASFGGSIAASLPSKHRTMAAKAAAAARPHPNLMARGGAVPPPSTSARTFTSFGSERDIRERDEEADLGAPLVSGSVGAPLRGDSASMGRSSGAASATAPKSSIGFAASAKARREAAGGQPTDGSPA
jgi:hypothetical protein